MTNDILTKWVIKGILNNFFEKQRPKIELEEIHNYLNELWNQTESNPNLIEELRHDREFHAQFKEKIREIIEDCAC